MKTYVVDNHRSSTYAARKLKPEKIQARPAPFFLLKHCELQSSNAELLHL